MEGRTVKLVSRDDVEFVLPVDAAKESRFVANSLSLDDNDNPEENESDLRVDVIRVSGGCLEKVVDFLKHFKEEPMAEITMPLPGPTFEDVSALFSTAFPDWKRHKFRFDFTLISFHHLCLYCFY